MKSLKLGEEGSHICDTLFEGLSKTGNSKRKIISHNKLAITFTLAKAFFVYNNNLKLKNKNRIVHLHYNLEKKNILHYQMLLSFQILAINLCTWTLHIGLFIHDVTQVGGGRGFNICDTWSKREHCLVVKSESYAKVFHQRVYKVLKYPALKKPTCEKLGGRCKPYSWACNWWPFKYSWRGLVHL